MLNVIKIIKRMITYTKYDNLCITKMYKSGMEIHVMFIRVFIYKQAHIIIMIASCTIFRA